jgi:endonuclease YncB( thermonuclease family)
MEWIKALMLASSIVAVDGDTVRHDGRLVRLQGFNTPELHGQCYAERKLAYRAKERLSAIISLGAKLRINPGHCAYGRACGTLTLDGKDVGEIMIREGLAEPMVCVNNRCPRPRDWCSDPER